MLLLTTPLGEPDASATIGIFFGCSSIQFSIHPLFPDTVSEVTWDTLSFTVQHLCDLRDAMPHY